MIRADHLIRWVNEHAVGASITVVEGWIRGSDLMDLAKEVSDREPFEFQPKTKPIE